MIATVFVDLDGVAAGVGGLKGAPPGDARPREQ